MASTTTTRRRKGSASTDERRVKVDALRERLEAFTGGLDDAQVAAITALWSGYSARNALLIAMQCPEATDVAGFRAWQERGRQVRKGEVGIQILAPAGQSKTDGEAAAPDANATEGESGDGSKPRLLFRLAHVFDVGQTDAIDTTAKD